MGLVVWLLLGLALFIFVRTLRNTIQRWYGLVGHPHAKALLDTSEDIEDDGCGTTEELGEDNQPTLLERNVVRPTKFRKWVVALLRAEHGNVKRSEANRLMISKTIRDILGEHKVRRTQWHKHIPVIEAMYFIPCNAQLEARELLGSPEALARDMMMASSVRSWWFWLKGASPLEYQR